MTGDFLSSALAGLISGGVVLAIAGYFLKRWIEGVDSRLKEMGAQFTALEKESGKCSLMFVQTFRTKDESEKAWTSHNADESKQWTEIDQLKERVTRVESFCRVTHGV